MVNLGKDVKEVSLVENLTSGLIESDVQFKKYATSFGDKIDIQFKNMFDYQTARFLSKDGKMIFFVKNDYVYGFENLNHQLKEIACGNLFLQHISLFLPRNYLMHYAQKVLLFVTLTSHVLIIIFVFPSEPMKRWMPCLHF